MTESKEKAINTPEEAVEKLQQWGQDMYTQGSPRPPCGGDAVKLYHVTTPHKLSRYRNTGAILPPVRGWRFKPSAENWMRRTGRTILLEIEVQTAYPLPDHSPIGHAYWSPETVRSWVEVTP